jgi:hypothetical protein
VTMDKQATPKASCVSPLASSCGIRTSSQQEVSERAVTPNHRLTLASTFQQLKAYIWH